MDPSLGRDSIRSGVMASAIGAGAVITFMLVYYLYAGLVADVALLFNILMLFGTMCSIGATLTIPGIAGIVLTIGMSVDANVLIFERIREERAQPNRCAAPCPPDTKGPSTRSSTRTSRRSSPRSS